MSSLEHYPYGHRIVAEAMIRKWQDEKFQAEQREKQSAADQGLKQGLTMTPEGRELLLLLGDHGLTKRGALVFITGKDGFAMSRGYHAFAAFGYTFGEETRRHLIGLTGALGRILTASDGNSFEETGETFNAIEYRPDLGEGVVVIRKSSAEYLVDDLGRPISDRYMDLLARDGILYGTNGTSYKRVTLGSPRMTNIRPIGMEPWGDLLPQS